MQQIDWTVFLAPGGLETWWPLLASAAVVTVVPGLTSWLRHRYKGDPADWVALAPLWWAWAPALLLSSGLWCFAAEESGYPVAWLVWVEAALGLLVLSYADKLQSAKESTLGLKVLYGIGLLLMSCIGGRVAADALLANSSFQDASGLYHASMAVMATAMLAGLGFLVGFLSHRYYARGSVLQAAAIRQLQNRLVEENRAKNLAAARTRAAKVIQQSTGLRSTDNEHWKVVEAAIEHGAQAVRPEYCDSESDAYTALHPHLEQARQAAASARLAQDSQDESARQTSLKNAAARLLTERVVALYQLHPNRMPEVLKIALSLANSIEAEYLSSESRAVARLVELWQELGLCKAWYHFDPDRVMQMIRRGHPLMTEEQFARLREEIGRIAMSILAYGCAIDSPREANEAVYLEWVARHGSKLELASLSSGVAR